MLDIKLLRDNPKLVEDNLRRRNDPEKLVLLKKTIAADKAYRNVLQTVEDLRREHNVLTKEISAMKVKKQNIDRKLKEIKNIPIKIKQLESEMETHSSTVHALLLQIPNLLDNSVPAGASDADSVEMKKIGKQPKFSFEPKNHIDILTNLDLIDTERAAKTSGHGFFCLKNGLALLDHALMHYAIDFLMKKKFTIVEPPFMLRREPYEGVVDIADFENVMYNAGDDMFLIATSEHPLVSMYMNETLLREQLPLRLAGISPCFRREVGAHGKYTKGLFRMHHFNKIEQVVFCKPEESTDMLETLQRNVEELYKSLGLYVRVVNVCSGDMGSIAAKKYDTEAWMADGVFREIGSNSNCTDYQARRLKIRYREKEGQSPQGFVHTLNSTAIATSRTMVALIEQLQDKDGNVVLPAVLVPYMHGLKKLIHD